MATIDKQHETALMETKKADDENHDPHSLNVNDKFSDDTESKGTDNSDDPEVNARRARRHRRHQYKVFIRENKTFWMWFNLIVAFFSVGFGVGTYFILEYANNNCGGLELVLWMVITLHAANTFMCLFNLCGIETKICNQNMICVFVIYEIVILAWL